MRQTAGQPESFLQPMIRILAVLPGLRDSEDHQAQSYILDDVSASRQVLAVLV